MDNPIADANAGAMFEVAPSQKHATRTATVAIQGNNDALQRAKQVNQIASTLGTAIGNFMEGKRATEMEQRYSEAYHAQGLKTGLDEFQKDLKRTGFTEFIYGGQSPEYTGALNASARNASNAVLLEEQQFVESDEGSAMTPQQYQQRIQDKITDYNKSNFSDAPDAAFAFMKNWKDNSNELTRQQFKNNAVYQQKEARRTVAEGFQTDLDVYKNTVKSNPTRAAELGKNLYSMANKPQGMSDTAYRLMLVDEGLTATEANDFSALQLMNSSGIVETFDAKERKRYDQARNGIDSENFDMFEAARLEYETVIENPAMSSQDVARARQQYDSAVTQVAARNTGTAKHMRTTFGADRHRGVLGNQYRKMLETEAKERVQTVVDREALEDSNFQVELYSAEPSERRGVLADRLDALTVALAETTLSVEVRKDLNAQFVKGQKQLDSWDSARDTADAKAAKVQAERELEEKEQLIGVQSLVTGGGYVAADNKAQKNHLSGAIDSVVNQIVPDKSVPNVKKLEQVFSSPSSMYKFIKGSGKFQGYIKESPEIKTAITNLAVGLRGELTEDNTFTEAQQESVKSLQLLQHNLPELYNASFTSEERAKNAYMIQAVINKKGVAESVRTLDTLEQRVDIKSASKMNGEELLEATGLGGAPFDIQDAVYTEYKNHLPLGEDAAVAAARTFAQGLNTKAAGVTVRYGSQFEAVLGRNLEDTMKMVGKTYPSGGVTKSGLTRALANLVGGSKDANGNELYKLSQIPGVQVSVFQGGLMLEYNSRVQMVQRPELEAEINGYTEWNNRRRSTK